MSPPSPTEANPESGVTVRRGETADLEAVFALVQELAEFERMPGEVATTPAIYRDDLAEGWFELLVAEDATGAVVGAMVYYWAYSTWKGRMLYLEDFVVAPDRRRQGIGGALWSSLVDAARAGGCTSIKWQVLNWNDSAKAFYTKMGAEMEGGWENGRLWVEAY